MTAAKCRTFAETQVSTAWKQ